jgi:hypothetical protein
MHSQNHNSLISDIVIKQNMPSRYHSEYRRRNADTYVKTAATLSAFGYRATLAAFLRTQKKQEVRLQQASPLAQLSRIMLHSCISGISRIPGGFLQPAVRQPGEQP